MVAKHAHKRQVTVFKYGGYIRLCIRKFKKSDIVIISRYSKWPEECQDQSPSFSTLTNSLRSATDVELLVLLGAQKSVTCLSAKASPTATASVGSTIDRFHVTSSLSKI